MDGRKTAPEPEDSHAWLEEVTGDKALAWTRLQNAECTRVLDTDDSRALEARIKKFLDSEAQIPYVQKLGRWYYNFWRDARHPRGLWRRTTLEQYRRKEPDWETVLDLDLLAAKEGENWVWHGVTCLEPECVRGLVKLSRGGADADVVREMDLEAKAFVPNGFFLPEAKSRVSWIDLDHLYVGTDFGPGSLTESGYPRIAKIWTRGTPLESAETLFEGHSTDVAVVAARDRTPGYERDFVVRSPTFYTNEMFVVRGRKLVKLEKPDSASADVHQEILLLTLREDWTVGGKSYTAGSLLACDFEEHLAGRSRFDVLFEPSARTSLAGVSPTRHHILVNELDNVRNRVYILTRADGTWTRKPLEGMPELGTVSASAVDSTESDDFFLTVTDFLTPTRLFLGTVGGPPVEILKELPSFFDASMLTVTQLEAISADGTRVPYFQVARRGLSLDGEHPTLLYGYGGFEVSQVPVYSPGQGVGWLERGGVYVVANIRGGGEFGPRWHQAALRANRHKAYDDFIAVALDLVRRGVTRPARLGIRGGSNGGLLVGNMLTRRPDLFGAVVCQVPLLDMRRYHRLLAGSSWMQEYGNPDDPEDWDFIRTFSPYHNVKAGVRYPPALFMTSTRDDRVHPGHARKMVARLLELGQDVLYYENIEGGHGGAANNEQLAHMAALTYSFLWQRLG
ncbi:MAG: S9 family peptidase [Candidatus Wallbacteria bacterium]|nr:S9 family peptidase [Candidatus Wallbacteria bacterium]